MDFTNEHFDAQSALLNDPNFLREITGKFLQHLLDEEFVHHIGARHYERSQNRRGQRNGCYSRRITTRVGTIELQVPRDRNGEFSTELFQRYQRSEKALVLALAEMYFRGVSTRKVSYIVEELCGHGISKSQVSELSKELDRDLEEWRSRSLDEEWDYLLLDAIYLKVREGGRVASVANFVAIGVSRNGQREVLGCHVATSEYRTEWKAFLRSLKNRGMNIPLLVDSDDHDGLREAIAQELTDALWQRCQVHYMRNFAGKLGAKQQGEMMPFLRSVLHATHRELAEVAKQQLVNRLIDRGLEKVADWIEETIDDTLNVLNLPEGHRKRMRSTNVLERLNREIRRRTRVIGIFPNRESCTRVVTSVCQEASESWGERKYLTFEHLEEDALKRLIEF